MKKYLIIGLIIAFVGAMVFRSCAPSSSDDSNSELPAAFAFEDNLATRWDEKVAIDIVVNARVLRCEQSTSANLKAIFR